MNPNPALDLDLDSSFFFGWIWIRIWIQTLKTRIQIGIKKNDRFLHGNRVGFKSGFGFEPGGFGFRFKTKGVDLDLDSRQTSGFGVGLVVPRFAHHWLLAAGRSCKAAVSVFVRTCTVTAKVCVFATGLLETGSFKNEN